MLKTRIYTAVVLVLILSYFLFGSSAEGWTWFVLIASLPAGWEWAGFAKIKKNGIKALFAGFTALVTWLSLDYLPSTSLMGLTALLMLTMLYSVIRYQKTQGQPVFKSPVVILLLGLFAIVVFSHSLILFRLNLSVDLLLLSFFSIWAIDTGAYFSGRRFGKRKLAVHVSPGKSWEGVWGGVLLSFVVAYAGLTFLAVNLTFNVALVAAVIAFIAMYSVLGDLFESLLKRQSGIKDSGKIFPGHGGMLDRIDSLVIAVPMFYVMWPLVLA